MSCDCKIKMRYVDDNSHGDNHHVNCPKFATEKNTYIFYYEDAVETFVPAGNVEDLFDVDSLDNQEQIEIRFKRVNLTDKEFSEIPEI